MTMGRIVLCADRESLVRPMLIGLDEASLDGKEWLVSIPDAGEAREFISGNDDVDEAWVVGSDDLEGVNLAAALRKDRPELPIFLIVFNANGSELSRAAQAGVTGSLSATEFCRKYDTEVRRRSLMAEAVGLELEPDMGVATAPAPPALAATGAPGIEGADKAPGSKSEAAAAATPSRAVPKREGNAFVVSFLSGSGGVGKSTVAAIAAYRAASKGFSTVVVDCDFQFGDLHQIMGDGQAVTIDDVLAEPYAIDALAKATDQGAPALIAAPSRLERSEALAGHLGELLEVCASGFEVVLVNTGASWTESHAQLLEGSAASVFLMDQRASSVHACRHALDLCMRLGIASAPFVFALNRCKRGALFSSVDIANALAGAHVFEIKDGGPEVEEMLGAGLASELAATKNELCASVDAMLDELLPSRDAFFGRRARAVERRGRAPKAKPVPGSPRGRIEARKAGRKAKARAVR